MCVLHYTKTWRQHGLSRGFVDTFGKLWDRQTDRQTDKQTHGHGDSKTNSAKRAELVKKSKGGIVNGKKMI